MDQTLWPFFVTISTPQKIYKKVSKFKTSFGQPPTWPCAYCSIHHFFSPSSFSILLSPIALLRSCLPAKWGPLLNVSQNKRPCFPTGRSKQATLSLLSNTDRGFRKCQLSLSCMSMCMSISLHFLNTFFKFLLRNNWPSIEISWRPQFDLCVLWNDYESKFRQHSSSHTDTVKREEKKKKKFLMTRTLRICCLNNFPMYHTSLLSIVTMLCNTFLVLIYFRTESSYLLAIFLQLPLPHPPPLIFISLICFAMSLVFLFFRFHT